MVKQRASGRITRQHIWVALLVAALGALALHAMGRSLICTCGTIKLWVGTVHSADNSQHLADWYSPSHVIHGFLFYLGFWLVARRRPPGERLIAATFVEASWELIENSRWIIDRYRH